jgi:fatty-acyl-CoA synthase
LRFFGTGASVCPPEIERRFLAAWPGDCVRQIYGMTESAGAITQTPHNIGQKPGSVGFPVALAEVAVLAGGQLHRGPSPTGEIVARGPHVFAGYVDPRHGAGSFHDGWLRSGDLGRIGADGEIYVTGRIKDIIIRGGHNIDPAGIEDAALGFPGVALAAAVGRPDPYSGETPMLFVSPSPGASIDPAALGQFVEGRIMESPARPRAIVVIPEFAADASRQDLQAAPEGDCRRRGRARNDRCGRARTRRRRLRRHRDRTGARRDRQGGERALQDTARRTWQAAADR